MRGKAEYNGAATYKKVVSLDDLEFVIMLGMLTFSVVAGGDDEEEAATSHQGGQHWGQAGHQHLHRTERNLQREVAQQHHENTD